MATNCANDNLPEKEKKEETQEIFISSAFLKQKVTEAKECELQSWLENDVYEVVPYAGHKLISVKWVISEKNVNGKPIIKARLVPRGYEEEDTVQSDSPTCYKESVRILLAVIASKSWKLHSLDIKTAFLQGRVMDRDVYLRPPYEANCKGHVWKLERCVYGLADTTRDWYLRVRDEFLRLGGEVSSFDPALFYWRVGPDIRGILGAYVDDFLYAGSKVF